MDPKPNRSPSSMQLDYTRPAESFQEALPLGNGRLEAMVYGGINLETLSLNCDSL